MRHYNIGIIAFAAVMAGMTVSCGDDLSEESLTKVVLVQDVQTDLGDNLLLAEGMSVTPSYTILPEDAQDPHLVFTSSDENVITVSAEGAIAAKGLGQAYVNINQSTLVKVVKSIAVKVVPKATSITFPDIDVYVNTRIDLSRPEYVTVMPEGAYNIFDGESANPEVMAFEDGAFVAKKPGNTTVSIRTKDGSNLSATASVTVREAISPTEIKIAEGVELALNEVMPLRFTMQPVDATAALIQWSSSDESIVTIDADGVMTAHEYGEAIITATTDKGVKASGKVEVVKGRINDCGMGLGIYKFSNGAAFNVTDGKTVVTFKEKQRADIMRGGTWLNADRYPILAFKIGAQDVDKMWHDYDVISSNDKNTRKFGSFKWTTFQNNVIKLSDDVRVVYVDLRNQCADIDNGYYASGEKWAYTFTVKTGNDSKTPPGYDFYWFKSFHSMDELNEYLKNEDK